METLVLTQGYMPHRVVGWQKAITMYVTGKVEVVETYDEVIRPAGPHLRMPAVVRLVEGFRYHLPKVRFSRTSVFTRDGLRCQYCGEAFAPRDLTFDHVVPRSQGGRTSWTNIVTACRPCNSAKGSRTPEQAGMRLLSRPTRPAALSFGGFRTREGVPASWRSWLRH